MLTPTLTADSKGISQEALVMSGVEMEEILDTHMASITQVTQLLGQAGGNTEMQMNAMMEIRDQVMDAIQLAELREDGAVMEETLGLKTSALPNVVIGDIFTESIAMMGILLMVMDVAILA